MTAQNQEAFTALMGSKSELVENLQFAGVQLADLRVTSSNENMGFTGDFMSGDDQSKNQQGSFEQQQRNDSERRRELWNQFYDQDVA